MKKTKCFITALLLSWTAMSAQSSADPELSSAMTLSDCLEYARANAYDNRIAEIGSEKAAVEVRLSASRLMPYLGLTTSGNLSFGRNIDPETNTYDNKQTLGTGFGLQMSMPLFDGLVSINNLKAARTALLRMRKSAELERDRVGIEVIRSFYEVSYCRAMVEQMERQLERDMTDLTATQRGKDLGTKSGADVAELAALVAGDEYELLNRRNLLRKAYLALRASMGMSLEGPELAIMENNEPPTIVGTAYAMHPKVAEAEYLCKEMNYRLRAARGAFSPTISFSGGISTSYYKMFGNEAAVPGFREQWRDNMGEWIGLSVSIPLFDGLATVNSVKRARLDLHESEVRLEQTKYELERETIEAEMDFMAASEEFQAAEKSAEAEGVAYKAVRRKYEMGMSSATDLYTAAAKLAAAEANKEGKRIRKIISLITLNYCKTGILAAN